MSAAWLPVCGRTAGEAPAPRERQFDLHYDATVSNFPANAQRLQLWLPVAHDDAFQKIERLSVETSVPYSTKTGAHGNQILHIGDLPGALITCQSRSASAPSGASALFDPWWPASAARL